MFCTEPFGPNTAVSSSYTDGLLITDTSGVTSSAPVAASGSVRRRRMSELEALRVRHAPTSEDMSAGEDLCCVDGTRYTVHDAYVVCFWSL